jgi:putative PEP-CTERM system TPR-repeat lipoprotein
LLNLARVGAAAGDEAGMVAYLERAVDAHPVAGTPQLMLARYYFATGKSEKVIGLTLQLTEDQKREPEVQEFLGLVSLSEQRFEDARFYLEGLVKQRPDSSLAHYLLSRAYVRLGEYEQWRAELDRSLELEPDNFLARRDLAYAWLIEGDLDRASAELAEVEKRFPDRPDILHLRATIARGEGNQEQASELLEQAFDAAPSKKTMLSLFGQRWHSGDREGAITLQEKWLAENPDDPYASVALGMAYKEENRIRDAVRQFEQALARDPDNPDLLNALAWLLRRDQTDRALRYAQQASELRPRDGNITDTLAVVLFYKGDIEQAASTIDQALKQLPGAPALRYHKAMIDAAMGNEERAAKMLSELLAEDPDFDERDEAMAFLDTLQ